MELQHSFSLPLHTNPCRLDPCINSSFIALPISKNIIGIWKISEVEVALFDRKSPPLPIELAGHDREVSALSFSNRFGHILASSCCEKILLWDLNSLEKHPTSRQFFNKPGNLSVMCFNNNDTLIAAGKDNQIILLEKEHSIYKATLEAHCSMISNLKFCPHYSATLVSISDDRTVCIWDVEKLCLLYQTSILSSSPLISMDMNLCDPHVAIGSADGNLKIFDLTDGHNFRQLASIDVANIVRKNMNRTSKEHDENKPVLITKKGTVSGNDAAFKDKNLFVEASESLLHLEYTYSSQTQKVADTSPNMQGHYSGAGDLIKDTPPSMSIITTNSIIHLNARTLDTDSISYFQHNMKSTSFSSSVTIGALSYAASKQINPHQSVFVVGTLFDRKIHILEWIDLSTKLEHLQPCKNQDSDTLSDCNRCFASEEELSTLNIVAIDPLLESSPLKSEMLPPVIKSITTKGDVATGKKKVVNTMNQPLTFKSKVKSSGYTKAPRTTMFKPETSKQKLLGLDDASKKKSSLGNTGVVKMLTKEYDQTKGPVKEECNSLQVDGSTTAIFNLRFSDDGNNLACALSNKTALAVKSPFSKHICTSYVGHNKQVNSVYWSNNNNYMLTSSNDKTVALWDKSGGDALIILDHQKGSTKEADNQTNSISNGKTIRKSKNLDSSRSSLSSTDNKPFSKEIKQAQFFYRDKFILFTHGNDLSLYKYCITTEVDDLKRYQTRNKYKLVEKWQAESSSFTSFTAVNNFYSHLVLCTTSGKAIEIYDVNKSVICHTFPECHSRPPHCVVINEGSGFSSQSSQAYNVFATAALTDPIKLWDVRSKTCIQALSGHLNNSHMCQLAISPCGNYVASGSEDRCAYIFDLRKGTFCEKLRGHNEVVCSVAFHPAIPLLATGSLNSRVIWYKSE